MILGSPSAKWETTAIHGFLGVYKLTLPTETSSAVCEVLHRFEGGKDGATPVAL